MTDKPATTRAIGVLNESIKEIEYSATESSSPSEVNRLRQLAIQLSAIAEGLRPRNPDAEEMPELKPSINVAWMAVMLDADLRAFRPTIIVEGRRYVLEGDPMPQAESDALVRRSDEALGALQVRAVDANVELIVEQRLAKALGIA